jgi:cupin 2 domain-containing protein
MLIAFFNIKAFYANMQGFLHKLHLLFFLFFPAALWQAGIFPPQPNYLLGRGEFFLCALGVSISQMGAGVDILQNIFEFSKTGGEISDELFKFREGRAVRILSSGQASGPGFWYEEEEDEWVIVLGGEGKIEWPNGQKKLLKAGDWLFLPAREKHRVAYTSACPPCVWLAVYGKEIEHG